ncbi:MAG: hypothetical protein ACM3PE_06045 [Deltaproteobacteria bacterium]
MVRSKSIIVSSDASGACDAVLRGMLVMIIDVIDMSTTLESALDAGAYAVLGASPDFTRAPVDVSPEQRGREAAILAREAGTGIIIATEPRVGSNEERVARCQRLIKGIEKEQGVIEAVITNLGAETPKLVDLNNRVVVAVSDTGGVAYDAAITAGGRAVIGTVARTYKQKGIQPSLTAVRRALQELKDSDTGIALVAASRNSMEDILAAQFIANMLIQGNSLK